MATRQPVDPARRIASIDALRGLALCGILFVNIVDMGGPIAMDRPMTAPALGDPDWQVWAVAQLFITGTMRGLFSMLFGAGLLIFIGEGGGRDRVQSYFRRLFLLLLFGIVDSTLLLWPGDILVVYALAGLIILALHRLQPIQLTAAAGVILLLISLWAGHEALGIAPRDMVYSPVMLALETAARHGGYAQNLAFMSQVSWTWTTNLLTFRWIGDAAAFMLIGMALFRSGLFAADADRALLRRLAGFGYGVGLVLRVLHLLLLWAHDGAPTLPSALLDQPGRLAMTLGHVGLFLLLWRRSFPPGLANRLAAMGRMALTLYLGQSLIAACLFPGFGLGLWNRLSWSQLWLVALVILSAQALFATLWFKRFRYGPAEWLWRWGTYRRRPPIVLSSP